MGKTTAAEQKMQKTQRNQACVEAFLERHGYLYVKHKEKPLLCVALPDSGGELGEIKAMLTIRERVVCIDVFAPLTSMNKKRMTRLVNRLNLTQRKGTFQYDMRDGEASLTQFIPAEGAEPDDEVFMETFRTGCEGVLRLHHALLEETAGGTSL